MAREKNTKAAGGDEAQAGFEQSMTELERIVEDLEGGQLTLDGSLAHYEKGMGLARRLTKTLDQAEKRIEKLVEAEGEDEAPGTTPLEADAPGPGGSEGELPF